MESQLAKTAKRTVLITGAGKRLGAAMSDTLAQTGWNIVLHVHQACAEAERLSAALCKKGFCASWISGDLSNPAQVDRVFDEARAQTGHLDALINNAARFTRSQSLPAEEAIALWQLNVTTPEQLTERLFIQCQEHPAAVPGCVINLLDQRITNPDDETPYTCTKRALAHFTQHSAYRYAPTLRLVGIAPGAILPPPDPATTEPAGVFPLAFRPTPHDIAKTAAFLLDAHFLTGQILYVDSGQHLLPTKERDIKSQT